MNLAIDDKTLKEIIRNLYYPDSPYEFSVLPADILGQVYEQFLGKVIRLTPAHQAKVEEKPEVRKAGGVYYTPTYIVDYIVENTVGKLVADKTPREIAARTKTWKRSKSGRPLSVLDPACGSGSFLIGAYQFLLDWYLQWYSENNPQAYCTGSNPRIYETTIPRTPTPSPEPPTPTYRLTTAEKKRILLDHIYGVDIDQQAVEVTKLSLLLKVLEGETQETLQKNLFAKERALPDLSENIKCGNSLIGPDFWQDQQMELFDEDERLRINTFDWQAEFSAIMSGEDGGFDAVIGNPPYVRQEGVSTQKPYLAKSYATYHGLADLYVYFYERALSLLRFEGRFGYITSSKFLQAGYGESLRIYLGRNSTLKVFLDYGDAQIFAGATTYPVVVIATKGKPDESGSFAYVKATDEIDLKPSSLIQKAFDVPYTAIATATWILTSRDGQRIIEKLARESRPLAEVVGRAQLGIKTSLNEAFVITEAQAKRMLSEQPAAADVIKPHGRGRDLTKWLAQTNGTYLVCTRISLNLKDYPVVEQHLQEFKSKLKDRYEVKRGDYDWWVVRQVAETEIFDEPKIVYPDLCSRRKFALNRDGMYPNNTVFSLPSSSPQLLAFLNSRLCWFWITHVCPANRGSAYRLFNQYMDVLPVRDDVLMNMRLGELGTAMIKIHNRFNGQVTPHERTALIRQIAITDAQIDQVLFDLYEVTEEEARMVHATVI